MWNLIVSVFLLIVVTGCSTIRTESGVDPQVDLSKYATYGWLTTNDVSVENVRVDNALVIESVRASVEDSLEKKGYVKVEEDNADFLVTWLGAVDRKIQVDEIRHFYNSSGYGVLFKGPASNTAQSGPQPVGYDEGTLVIHLVDPNSHKVFWQGSAKERVREGMSDKDVKLYIDQSIKQILNLYPSVSR